MNDFWLVDVERQQRPAGAHGLEETAGGRGRRRSRLNQTTCKAADIKKQYVSGGARDASNEVGVTLRAIPNSSGLTVCARGVFQKI